MVDELTPLVHSLLIACYHIQFYSALSPPFFFFNALFFPGETCALCREAKLRLVNIFILINTFSLYWLTTAVAPLSGDCGEHTEA